MPDFTLFNHGSICVLLPRNETAIDWIDEHIGDEALRWGRHGVVIEPRYIRPILDGIGEEGLSTDVN